MSSPSDNDPGSTRPTAEAITSPATDEAQPTGDVDATLNVQAISVDDGPTLNVLTVPSDKTRRGPRDDF